MDVLVKVRTKSEEEAEALLARINKDELLVRKRYPTHRCPYGAELRLKYTKLSTQTCLDRFRDDMRTALRKQLGLEFNNSDIVVNLV